LFFAFDYGGDIGFRIAARHHEWIAGVVVQNANAYGKGLSALTRGYVGLRREDERAPSTLQELMTLEKAR
jgi:pimeloyl-ACP methyl ester carboxylesterase